MLVVSLSCGGASVWMVYNSFLPANLINNIHSAPQRNVPVTTSFQNAALSLFKVSLKASLKLLFVQIVKLLMAFRVHFWKWMHFHLNDGFLSVSRLFPFTASTLLLPNIRWMPTSVSKRFGHVMKISPSRWFKWYPTAHVSGVPLMRPNLRPISDQSERPVYFW